MAKKNKRKKPAPPVAKTRAAQPRRRRTDGQPAKDRSKSPRRRPASASARKVVAAVKAFDRAQQTASARAASLLNVADDLGNAAVARMLDALVKDLADRMILHDLAALNHALESAPPGVLPSDLEAQRLTAMALLAWLREHFGLEPHLECGQVIEIPVQRLERFRTICQIQAPPGALIAVRVVESGWNRQGRPVVLPCVEPVPASRDS